MKIIKIYENHKRIIKIMKNYITSCDENHESFRITHENQENHENHRIRNENYEKT